MMQELGTVWAACGINTEWARLKAVLLHAPGLELAASGGNPDAIQMLAPVDWAKARAQHEAIGRALAATVPGVLEELRRLGANT